MSGAIWFCIGVLLFFTGTYLGAFAQAVRFRRIIREMQAEPLKQICDCRHIRTKHLEDGSCQEEIQRATGTYTFKWVQCACLKYSGPVNAMDLIAPPVLPSLPALPELPSLPYPSSALGRRDKQT